MTSRCNEINNPSFLPKRRCLIWPLITFWTSSGTSLPSLLFSLPQINHAPSLSFDYVLPSVWNPLSHVGLLCGSLLILRVTGRHFKTILLRRRSSHSLISASCFSFILFSFLLRHNMHTIKYLKQSNFKCTVQWLLYMHTYTHVPLVAPAPSQHSYVYCYLSDL